MAQIILPQLASSPKTAVFTREDFITLFAIIPAVSSSAAPSTIHSKSFVAPSPSLAISLATLMQRAVNAFLNISKSLLPVSTGLFPARPLAIMLAISLVEVSPSMLSILKLTFTAAVKAL